LAPKSFSGKHKVLEIKTLFTVEDSPGGFYRKRIPGRRKDYGDLIPSGDGQEIES